MSAVANSPIGYVIGTQFRISGVTGLGLVTRQLAGVERQVDRLAGRVSMRLGAAFAAVATGHGIARLVGGIAKINGELEGATVGIATMFNAFHKTPMEQAMVAARAQLKGLREDAAKGVGGLTDYAQGFQRIYAPGIRAGLTRDQIRELNRLAIGAAGAAQKPLREGPRDVVQALTSGVSERQTPEVVQALATIGVTAAQFRAMGKRDQGQTLLRAFRSFQPGIEAYGRTWDAQLATMKDNVIDLSRIVTMPLFERWKEQLTRVNEWIDKNRQALEDIASRIGPRLVAIYDRIGQGAVNLAAGSAVLGAAGFGGRAAGGLARSVTVLAPPGNGATFNKSANRWQGADGKFVGMTAIGIGAAPVGIFAAIGASIVGMIAASLTAAIRRFPALGKDLGKTFAGLFEELTYFGSALVGLLNNPFLSDFGLVLGRLIDVMGKSLTAIVRLATLMTQAFGIVQNMGYASMRGTLASFSGDTVGEAVWGSVLKANAASLAALFVNGLPRLLDERTSPGGKPGDQGMPTTDNNYNFNGPIEIKITAERMDDPNIVAVTLDEVFRRLAESRKGVRPVMRPGRI